MHITWISSNLPSLRLEPVSDAMERTEDEEALLEPGEGEMAEPEDEGEWLEPGEGEVAELEDEGEWLEPGEGEVAELEDEGEWQVPDREEIALKLLAEKRDGEGVVHCDKQVNLFIGPNASGKSTILRAINRLYSLATEPPWLRPGFGDEDDDETQSKHITRVEGGRYVHSSYGDSYYSDLDWQVRYGYWEANPTFSMGTSDDWPRGASGLWLYRRPDSSGSVELGDDDDPVPPLLYIPATRVNLPGQHVFDQRIADQTVPESWDFNDFLDRMFETESGVFYGQYVETAIDEIHRMGAPWPGYFYPDGSLAPEARQVRRALDIGYSCAKGICSEVIYDDTTHPYVELKESGSSSSERIVHHNMGIGTADNILGEPLYAGALSSGTQGTLLWVWALTFKMAYSYLWEVGWEKKPAILLIDEIENHLHPTWQRRVIPALLEHFPGLQIFATTHSPFVVAGLKAGQAHLLKRDEDGHVTATTNKEDVIGWTTDEILRNMMGVEDPTDNETAEAARELRQLRNEEPRSDSEEEEARQLRIQELRQLVDRDLLAGGPWKKQRELFEQQFAEALQKYQQSQGLNQENG